MARLEFTGQACIETPPFAYGPDYTPDAWAAMVADTEKLVEAALGA